MHRWFNEHSRVVVSAMFNLAHAAFVTIEVASVPCLGSVSVASKVLSCAGTLDIRNSGRKVIEVAVNMNWSTAVFIHCDGARGSGWGWDGAATRLDALVRNAFRPCGLKMVDFDQNFIATSVWTRNVASLNRVAKASRSTVPMMH